MANIKVEVKLLLKHPIESDILSQIKVFLLWNEWSKIVAKFI